MKPIEVREEIFFWRHAQTREEDFLLRTHHLSPNGRGEILQVQHHARGRRRHWALLLLLLLLLVVPVVPGQPGAEKWRTSRKTSQNNWRKEKHFAFIAAKLKVGILI